MVIVLIRVLVIFFFESLDIRRIKWVKLVPKMNVQGLEEVAASCQGQWLHRINLFARHNCSEQVSILPLSNDEEKIKQVYSRMKDFWKTKNRWIEYCNPRKETWADFARTCTSSPCKGRGSWTRAIFIWRTNWYFSPTFRRGGEDWNSLQ